MFLQRLIIGILGLLLGVAIIARRELMVKFFGRSEWADTYLSGGLGKSFLMWQLIGIAIIIISLLYLTGRTTDPFSAGIISQPTATPTPDIHFQ
ncbi:MAG: hypothetical protein HY459_04535 [Parcubacteria group bacterium]|nr:hypothetical protein [Parcubacteria group bacterium]